MGVLSMCSPIIRIMMVCMLCWGWACGCSRTVPTPEAEKPLKQTPNALSTPLSVLQTNHSSHPPEMIVTESDRREAAAQYTAQYLNATDLRGKIKSMLEASRVGGIEAIMALGQMFQSEQDVELREEILETLMFIPGHDVDKLSLLAVAAAQNQPQSVRETAIDLMIDLGSPNAIQVLQGLLDDKNPLIREAAEDAIREIRTPTSTVSEMEIEVDDD